MEARVRGLEQGFRTARQLLVAAGHTPSGPGGGRAWAAQMALVGLAAPDLRASVPVPGHLGEALDRDARRLARRGAVEVQLRSGRGRLSFEGVELRVDRGVFVPRGESRHLVEAAASGAGAVREGF